MRVKTDEDGNITGLAPDWVKTKQLWENDPEAKRLKKRIFHFNEHTNGVRYKIYWAKASHGIVNKVLYTFVPVRSFKRAVRDRVIGEKREYRIL